MLFCSGRRCININQWIKICYINFLTFLCWMWIQNTGYVSLLQYEYFNAVLINERDEEGNYLELGKEFILVPNDHFNNLPVNISLSDVQVPTNMYNKGKIRTVLFHYSVGQTWIRNFFPYKMKPSADYVLCVFQLQLYWNLCRGMLKLCHRIKSVTKLSESLAI